MENARYGSNARADPEGPGPMISGESRGTRTALILMGRTTLSLVQGLWGAHRELGERNGDLGKVARLPWMIENSTRTLSDAQRNVQTCRRRDQMTGLQ